MTAPNPPLPPVTINQLVLAGRVALLDPVAGPVMPSPGLGFSRLQDCRIQGKSIYYGEGIGTQNWEPGSTGWPWGLLSVGMAKHDNRKETGRVWSDYVGQLAIALTSTIEDTTDFQGWALDWDEVLTQWFALHRRFNRADFSANGDIWWEYEEGTPRPFVVGGIAAYGLIARLKLHNVVAVTYGV